MENKIFYKSIKEQFNIAFSLLEYHLNGLSEKECLWKPCEKGLFVEKIGDVFVIPYPESEKYSIGSPNIAWVLWHITFWWEMVFDYSFGQGTLKCEDVKWSGSFATTKKNIYNLKEKWIEKLDTFTDEQFLETEIVKFPFTDKPFYDLAMWLNLELMKNAAEIGSLRFLYGGK